MVFLKKYPDKVKGLKFGYICPGAMKTIEFLNNKKDIDKDLVKKIQKLTDFQFFVEIYVIYKPYLDKELKDSIKKILGNKSCKISNLITEEITRLFGELPPKVKKSLPDNFYHVRHNTLICSKDKTLAKQRINLLKSIYNNNNNNEKFTNYQVCHGKRDGVSGCRDCCSKHYTGNQWNNCVDECMKY